MKHPLTFAITVATMLSTLPLTCPAINFQPHDTSAPAATVDGSIRGAEGDLSVTVLAPPRLAVTSDAHPTFYWFASNAVRHPVEFVVVEEQAAEPIFITQIDPPLAAGIHRFDLPETSSLESGKTYQWSVAVVPDPDARSNDVFSSALLEKVEPSAQVKETLRAANGQSKTALERAEIWASLGFWYESMAEITKSASQANDSDSSKAQAARITLLQQAGLHAVAEFERRNGNP